MTSELRRSFKEKAKEKFGFSLNRRNDVDRTPSSPDEGSPPQSAPPRLPSPKPGATTATDKVTTPQDTVTMATRPSSMSSMIKESDSTDGREKRRSRHLVQPKGTITYEVSGRDTLASIAAQFDTTTSELKKVNKLMTTMVFPGQVVYVPDKDYVPSEGSHTPTPTSPTGPSPPGSLSLPPEGSTTDNPPPPGVQNGTSSPPPRDTKAAFDLKLTRRPKGPGLAERLRSSDGDVTGAQGYVPPGDEEVRKIDQNLSERFIKVNVKHITDGQGVVSGVLLVTPNAIMFDPNVSDPLVVERGPEEYGMIAPMDTIISAAMYHDIAAMSQKNRAREDGSASLEVYHDKSCSLYKHRASSGEVSVKESSPRDMPPSLSRMPRSESVCSCGALDQDRAAFSRDRVMSDLLNSPVSGDTQVVQATSSVTRGFLADDIETSTRDTVDSGEMTRPEPQKVTMATDSTKAAGDCASDSERAEEGSSSTSHTSSIPAADSAKIPAEPDLDSLPASVDRTTAASDAGLRVQERLPSVGSSEEAGPDTQSATDISNASLTPQMQIGNIQYFRCEAPDTRRTPSPQREDLSVPRDSGGSPRPSSSPKEQGLLSRTLESISSLGSSFPGSPNLSTLATGLFNWNQDSGQEQPVSAASLLRYKSQDENDVFMEQEQPITDKEPITTATDGTTPHDDNRPKTHRIMDVDVAVENVVKLQDKPELFKDLSAVDTVTTVTPKPGKKKELIPRPAAHYEDPPLYLCLRIGLPSNKKVSKTCPIESYMKQKQKPEYWFCIPRDKVDPLYAFFLQWSPNIYGSDDEMSFRERGFVVVDENEEEADLELIDNHFDKKMTPDVRAMSKDWEIVNLEEARRRLSCAEVENLPLPELSERSCILNDQYMRRLCLHLPARAEGYPWSLIYSSEKHGFSLKTLYRTMHKIDCPILIVIKDTDCQVFGAMLPCAIIMSDHFYGTGESFLFTFYPEFQRFGWSGVNSFFIKGNAESLAIGAGKGSFGIWLDGDLYHGRTESCETFNNDLLTTSEDFVVQGLEAWGFI